MKMQTWYVAARTSEGLTEDPSPLGRRRRVRRASGYNDATRLRPARLAA
jgi:hypothetical protein